MTTNERKLIRSNTEAVFRVVALALAGTVLVAFSAQIKVPMWPVPMTLQSLAVLFIGLTYGGRMATATLALYLTEGAVGLPVFANGGGIALLLGPTGGYLFGFLLAAALLGFASDRNKLNSPWALGGFLTLASALIYLPGVLWLARFIGVQNAVMAGMIPFLIGDVIKAVIAAMAAPFGKKVLKNIPI